MRPRGPFAVSVSCVSRNEGTDARVVFTSSSRSCGEGHAEVLSTISSHISGIIAVVHEDYTWMEWC